MEPGDTDVRQMDHLLFLACNSAAAGGDETCGHGKKISAIGCFHLPSGVDSIAAEKQLEDDNSSTCLSAMEDDYLHPWRSSLEQEIRSHPWAFDAGSLDIQQRRSRVCRCEAETGTQTVRAVVAAAAVSRPAVSNYCCSVQIRGGATCSSWPMSASASNFLARVSSKTGARKSSTHNAHGVQSISSKDKSICQSR